MVEKFIKIMSSIKFVIKNEFQKNEFQKLEIKHGLKLRLHIHSRCKIFNPNMQPQLFSCPRWEVFPIHFEKNLI